MTLLAAAQQDPGEFLDNVYFPTGQSNAGASVLLVADGDAERVTRITGLLTRFGYVVSVAQTLGEGIKRLREQFIDALVLDVAIPETEHVGIGALLSEARDKRPGLEAILISSAGTDDMDALLRLQYARTIEPGIALHYDRATNRPYDADSLTVTQLTVDSVPSSRFVLDVREAFREFRARNLQLLSSVLWDLLQGQQPGQLPFDLGERALEAYGIERYGGTAFFLADSITPGGAAVRVDPNVRYSPNERAVVLQLVPRAEAVSYSAMYDYLKEKRPSRRIQAPLGYYPDPHNPGSAMLAREFIIATTFGDLVQILGREEKNLSPVQIGRASALKRAVIDLVVERELPNWHADTHSRVMDEDHYSARQRIETGQTYHMLLFANNLPAINGNRLPNGKLQELDEAVNKLWSALSDTTHREPHLLVMRMDPKGRNLGLATYQARSPANYLLDRYTTVNGGNVSVNGQLLTDDFAHWGFGPSGAVSNYFAELWQFLLDPNVGVPDSEKLGLVEKSVRAAFPGANPGNCVVEALKQGLYRSMFRSYVVATHAQVNESRLAALKIIDPDFAEGIRGSCQRYVGQYFEQAVRFSYALHAALLGHWKDDENAFTYAGNAFAGNEIRVPDNSASTIKLPRLRNAFEALKAINNTLLYMVEQGYARFDPEALKRNHEAGTPLSY